MHLFVCFLPMISVQEKGELISEKRKLRGHKSELLTEALIWLLWPNNWILVIGMCVDMISTTSRPGSDTLFVLYAIFLSVQWGLPESSRKPGFEDGGFALSLGSRETDYLIHCPHPIRLADLRVGKSSDSGDRQTKSKLIISCLIFSKILNPSIPHFPHM